MPKAFLITLLGLLIAVTPLTAGITDARGESIDAVDRVAQMARVERTLQVDGIERRYIAHVPADAGQRQELSILFAFHPALSNAEKFEQVAPFFAQSGAEDFLIIYPDGIGRTWNTGECCGQAKKQEVDELAFIRAIFADAARFGAISEARNFAVGFSNGAGLSHYLACNMPERFTAIAVTGGKRNMDQGCGPITNITANPVSVFLIHGLEDTLSPYNGGPSRLPTVQQTDGVPALTAYWTGANQCRAQQTSLRLAGIKCDEAVACRGESLVITCPIPNMGHWWPGHDPSQRWATRMFGPARPDLPAAREIIEFFRQHP